MLILEYLSEPDPDHRYNIQTNSLLYDKVNYCYYRLGEMAEVGAAVAFLASADAAFVNASDLKVPIYQYSRRCIP